MDWIPFALASIPAAVSIFGALAAGRFARKTKELEIQAQRVRDLETRLAEKKYGVYQPMIDLLSNMLDPDVAKTLKVDDLRADFRNFDAWIAIYGSDDAVRAWHNLRQGAFKNAPRFVLLRLYADFVIAARRDMGHPDTEVSSTELLGIRTSDLYDKDTGELTTILGLDWSDMERHTGWKPPWTATDRALSSDNDDDADPDEGPREK